MQRLCPSAGSNIGHEGSVARDGIKYRLVRGRLIARVVACRDAQVVLDALIRDDDIMLNVTKCSGGWVTRRGKRMPPTPLAAAAR